MTMIDKNLIHYMKIVPEMISDELLDKMEEIENQMYVNLELTKQDEDNGLVENIYDRQLLLWMFYKCDYVLGCFYGKEIIGYIAFSRGDTYTVEEDGKDDVYLFNFMVDKNYRKSGIGTNLIINAYDEYLSKISDCEFATLDVEARNSVLKFYEKLGFIKNPDINQTKTYYYMRQNFNSFLENVQKLKMRMQLQEKQ